MATVPASYPTSNSNGNNHGSTSHRDIRVDDKYDDHPTKVAHKMTQNSSSGENENGADAIKEQEEEDYEPYIPVRVRRQLQAEKRLARRRHLQAQEEERRRKEEEKLGPSVGPQGKQSLVQSHGKSMQEGRIIERSELEKQLTQEQEILRSIRNAKELKSVEELAKGIKYNEPIKTSWRPPRYIRSRTNEQNDRIRQKWNMIVEGIPIVLDTSYLAPVVPNTLVVIIITELKFNQISM